MTHAISLSAFGIGLALALVLAATGLRADKPHGVWVKGENSACELACASIKREAFRGGHYLTTQTHYTICRASLDVRWPEYRGRPGFQHQPGSPNVCKIQGPEDGVDDYDCLCN